VSNDDLHILSVDGSYDVSTGSIACIIPPAPAGIKAGQPLKMELTFESAGVSSVNNVTFCYQGTHASAFDSFLMRVVNFVSFKLK